MKLNLTTLVGLACVLLLALSAAPPARADYQSTVLSQGPAGYWRLNETLQPPSNGTTPNLGSLGASANGTYNNSPTYQLTGPFAGSLAVGFDGLSQYVSTPWVAGLNANAFSVELWVKPSQVPKFAYVASSAELNSPRSGWYLAQDDGSTFGFGSSFVVRMFYQVGASQSITLHAPVPAAGSWYHLVLTYNGTTATLYTNGVVADSGTPLGYVANVDGPFTVGCRSSLNFFWPGQAAEVAMYSGALSGAQVSAHYSTGTTTPANYVAVVQADSPVLYHRFREASSSLALNSGTVGSAADAKYQFGTTPGIAGPRTVPYTGFETTNNAVGINGNGASVSVPALNFNTNTVTISCWVNASNAQSVAAGIVLCDAGTTYSGLTIDAVSGGLGLGYVWNNDPGSYNFSPTTDAGLPTLPGSDWAYVALVVKPNQAEIYICGTNNPANFTSATNHLAHGNQAFDGSTLFGSDAGQPTFSFNGAIDEVAMFNRALGAGELYSQYASAIGGLGPKIFAGPQAPADPVFSGDTLTLSVDAGGTPNLSFQWYKTASGAISGATNQSYTKVNIQTTDSDTYFCVITNLYNAVTSAGAAITVNQAVQPVVVTPPSGHNLYPGGTINLSVVASGGGLKYQWIKNTTNIAGATSATYQVLRATTNDAGSYSVLVSNSVSTATGGPALINVFAPSNGYEAAIVADAPEAWYRLNETSGINMFDSMGRHDGIYTNVSGSPVTFGAAGAVVGSGDTAVTFSGDSSLSYGLVPFSPQLNAVNFTIECWAKTSDTVNSRAAVSSHSGSPLQGYGVWTVPAGSWSGQVSGPNSAGAPTDFYVGSSTASDGIVPGQWEHIVMVYGTSLNVYINGQWDGANYVNFTRNTGAPFIIGGFGGTTVTMPWLGQVDEVLVYTNALTLAQAQNHYSKAVFPNPIPPFFLVLPTSNEVISNSATTVSLIGLADGPVPIRYQWFKDSQAISGATNATLSLNCTYSNAGSYVLQATNINGFTNSPAATFAVLPVTPASVNVTNGLVLHLKFDGSYLDSSGRGNNGTPTGTNALPSIVGGRIGSGALHYATDTTTGVPIASNPNGVVTDSSYVTLGNPADLQFGSSVDFSVSFWMRLPSGYLNGDLPFLCSSVGSFGNPGFTFAPGYTNGSFSFSYNGIAQTEGNPGSINDGNWHHLVYTVSRTGYAFTYLDSVQVDSRLATGIGNINTAGPIHIGQDSTGLYPEQGSADLDDLAVWRRSLTSYEAYSIYYAATNSNSSFDVPAPVALKVSYVGTNVVLTWNPGATLGTLLQADDVTGPWTPVGVYVPVYTVPPSATKKFYRLNLSE